MYIQKSIISKLILYCEDNDCHLTKYEEKTILQKEIHEAIIIFNKDNITKKIIFNIAENEWQCYENIEYSILEKETIEMYKNIIEKDLTFPARFWTGDIGKKRASICLRYLCENILNLKKEEVPKKITKDIINKYKLGGLLRSQFNDSVYFLVNSGYEEEFQPWDFKRHPRKFWGKIENRVEAFEWYLEQNKNNFGKHNKVLTRKHICQYNLIGLINYYNGSIYKMIEELEPEIKKRKKKYKDNNLNITQKL